MHPQLPAPVLILCNVMGHRLESATKRGFAPHRQAASSVYVGWGLAVPDVYHHGRQSGHRYYTPAVAHQSICEHGRRRSLCKDCGGAAAVRRCCGSLLWRSCRMAMLSTHISLYARTALSTHAALTALSERSALHTNRPHQLPKLPLTPLHRLA